MDYEKKYKEALEKARQIHNADRVSGIELTTCEEIFPELKESDDERVRKEIITHFKAEQIRIKDPKRYNSWITWLEKHGKNNMGISEATKRKLEFNLNKALEKETPESWNEFLDGQGEQKLADKAERKGMNIVEEDMTPFQKKVFCIIDTTIEEEQGLKQVCDELLRLAHDEIMQKTFWSEEDESNLDSAIYYIRREPYLERNVEPIVDWLRTLKDRVQPKQEWSDVDKDILFRTIDNLKFLRDTISIDPKYAVNIIDIEREIDLLKNLKDRVRPKQKWSEEDKMMLQYAIEHFERQKGNCIEGGGRKKAMQEFIDWLKFLKDRYTWKPSDEQMVAIQEAINIIGVLTITGSKINSLYQDLKKLREG